ncbi:hypothetical protein [uncultured Roseobacter sp.]|uniref:hypothetical protein n=1 Tax=uncultured Roseobacter sp. TaxID=114847 RepID=UPI002614DD61|nr:hypothetical protein [uncultured Roseobacter sp.]
MTLDDTAKALLTGEEASMADLQSYWAAVDVGARPREEIIGVLAVLGAGPSCSLRMQSFVRYVRSAYPPARLPAATTAVNIVGTGGGLSTFNISTTAAIVTAAAGGRVLKSGSSAYSSSVGSADIMQALGLSRATSDSYVDAMLSEVGLAFAAPQRYAALCKRLAIAAMPLNFKIVGRFVNTLGPLICPYDVRASVIGASTPERMRQLTGIARTLQIPALMAHSELGVDEFLSIGCTRWQWADAAEMRRFCGSEIGLSDGPVEALAGGTLDDNLTTMLRILRGRGPRLATQTVAVNAGAALYAGGIARDIAEGTRRALDCIRSGAPFDTLEAAQAFAKKNTGKARASLQRALA